MGARRAAALRRRRAVAQRQQSKAKRAVRQRKAVAKAQWRAFGDPARVLALDVSGTCVGWAFFEDRKLTRYGRRRQEGPGHGQRLAGYHDWLLELFTELAPTVVVVEAPFQGRFKKAFAVLSLYRGILLAAYHRHFGVELEPEYELPARLIKRVLDMPDGLTHDEHKAAMVAEINSRYGTRFRFYPNDRTKLRSEDDIADAIAVGEAWFALYAASESGGADE